MVNNLMKLASSGEISITGAKPKLPTTIPNLTDTMLDVYRIPLKYLYFNDENGRISTQIKRDFGKLVPQCDDVGPEYNDKIARFVEEDNIASLKKTKKSIKEKGQQVYGYVLLDGRIIDGNRRFTALRQLETETEASHYFEAVILPFTYDARADRAQIKRLELAIQMGVEEKLQYDPVDLAVDIYQTIIEDELMTAKDYSHEANMSDKDVKDRIATVELMHDFLEFINASTSAYYIIKDVKLYTPLYELAKKFAVIFPNKGPKYEQSKMSAFALLGKMVLTGGDTGRDIREYVKDVLNSPINDTYNDSVENTIEDLRDKLESKPINSAAEFRKRLEEATPELREVTELYNTTVNRQARGKNVDNFITSIRENLNMLNDIKRGSGLTGHLNFNNFSKDQVEDIRDMMIKINLISGDLIGVYEDEL